jgi:hypothetical protein
VGAASRRAFARRRWFAATAAVGVLTAQKEQENANSAENPDWADYRGDSGPPDRRV